MANILYETQIFDAKANRRIDANGRLVIERSLITRECVNNYLGSELLKSLDPAEAAALGLEANKTYAVFRPGAEMEKALPAFNRIPLLKEHVMDYPDMPQQENRTGSISDSTFEAGKVFASITVWDKDSIREIQNESKRDLSLGYKSKFAKEPGVFNGVNYDLKMYDIVPNHLALVEKGRVPGAEVFDGKSKQGVSMAKKDKAGILAAIKAIFDAAPEEEVKKPEAKVEDNGIKEKVIALLNEKLGDKAAEIITLLEPLFAEEVTDESLAAEHKAGAAAAKEGLDKFLTAEEKESKELKDAKDEAAENKAKEAKEIMDSAISLARAEMLARETAKEEVRAVTGSLGILDSASAYYKAGCEAMGLETKGIMDNSAFKPMFKAAKAMRDKTTTPAVAVMDKDAGKTAETRINGILDTLPERKFN